MARPTPHPSAPRSPDTGAVALPKPSAGAADPLRELAGLYGIQTSYTSVSGRRRRAPSGTLLALLRTMECPDQRRLDVPDALRARRQELWWRMVEPVTVAWDGRAPGLTLRLPAERADGPISTWLALEGDEERRVLPTWLAPGRRRGATRRSRGRPTSGGGWRFPSGSPSGTTGSASRSTG